MASSSSSDIAFSMSFDAVMARRDAEDMKKTLAALAASVADIGKPVADPLWAVRAGIKATAAALAALPSIPVNKFQLGVTPRAPAGAAPPAQPPTAPPGAPRALPLPSLPSSVVPGLGGANGLATELTAGLGLLAAKLFAVKEAAELMGSALKRGLAFNAEGETLTTAFAAAIAMSQNVKDSTGNAATGLERFNIAAVEGERQMQALRAASATTGLGVHQLGESFLAALGPGSSAGGSVDQLRTMAVRLTQAARVLNLADSQLRTETREIISGNNLRSSEINTAFLQFTSAEIKVLREKGTLIDEINKRLEFMAVAGQKAAETFDGTMNRFRQTVSAFLGAGTKTAFDSIKTALQDAMEGVFDPSSGQIGKDFKGLADLADRLFGGIGTVLSDGIRAASEAAKGLSAWFDKNRQNTEATFVAVGNIYTALKATGVVLADAASLTGQVSNGALNARSFFSAIAVVVAAVSDLLKGMVGVIGYLGASVVQLVLSPFVDVAKVIDKIKGTNFAAGLEGLRTSVKGLAADAKQFGLDGFKGNATKAMLDKIAADYAASPLKALITKPRLLSETGTVTAPAFKPKPEKDKGNSAELAAQKALDEAEKKAAIDHAKALRDVERAELEKTVAMRTQTQLGYLQAKAAIDQREVDDEIKTQQKLRAAREKALVEVRAKTGDASNGEDARKKIRAEIITIDGQLELLKSKKVTIDINLQMQNIETVRAQVQLLEDMSVQLLDAQGNTFEAKMKEISLAEQRLLEDVRVRGDKELEEAVRKQADRNRLTARRDDTTSKIDVTKGNLALDEDKINQKREQGLISEVTAQSQIRDARLAAAKALEVNIDLMEKLAEASNDPRLKLQAAQMRQEYKKLAETQDSLAVSLNQGLFSALKQGFTDLTTGAKSFGEVMRNVLSSVLQQLAAVLLKQGLIKAFGSSADGGGGGWGGVISSLIKGFATGGHIQGKGTGTSDDILAWLSNGEYVLKASAVQSLGLHNVEHMNRHGSIPAFSTGGAVSQNIRANPMSLKAGDVHQKNVLVLDGDQLRNEMLNHPEANRHFVQIAAKNGKQIKGAWGS